LDRRKDRWTLIRRHLDSSWFFRGRFERFAAMDGLLEFPKVKAFLHSVNPKMFNFTKLSPTELGCWASHILMWTKRPAEILEDDARMGLVFERDWPRIREAIHAWRTSGASLAPDLVWMGFHKAPQDRGEEMLDLDPKRSIIVPIEASPVVSKIGGTFGYFLTPNGCTTLLKLVQESELPVTCAVDSWMMGYGAKHMRQYVCIRPILWSSYSKDSDIIHTH
jgi:GR25 family glycosyltransferase involved in LPS biosynthesis